jgi:trehalose 6-phosphate synthase
MGSQVVFQNRIVDVLIGIEPQEFTRILEEPAVQSRCEDLKEKYKGVQLMVSVDRLDYIKGIPLRIAAIDTLLTKHPELVGKIVLLQVVIPSREGVEGYRDLHASINETVSAVNGKYGIKPPIYLYNIVVLTGYSRFRCYRIYTNPIPLQLRFQN